MANCWESITCDMQQMGRLSDAWLSVTPVVPWIQALSHMYIL
jgi:hypothetical protein